MPRHRKKKLRKTHKKRRQARDESQDLDGARATTDVEEESLSTPSPIFEGLSEGSCADESHNTPEVYERSPSTSTFCVDTSLDDDFNSQDEDGPNFSDAESLHIDLLEMKASLLAQILLYKYRMKQPITKADIMEVVNQKYEGYFSEILKRASELIEIVFAVEVKEVDSTTQNYALVSKLNLPNKGRVRPGRGFPKTSLLMTLLGMILLKGNRATEEEIWKFLNTMRVFAGRKHYIYGEPRKLITKDLVKLKYLEYQQVPNSEPPRYEFLWGPKAHDETSRIKILEFVAKVNNVTPSVLLSVYEEALRGEKEKAQTRLAVEADPMVMVSTLSRATSIIFCHPLLAYDISSPSSSDHLLEE